MKTRRLGIIYALLSLLVPAIIMVIALLGMHIAPFGDHTLVISDANGLYINYLAYVGRMAQGLEGFFYSFEKGLGGNMMGSMGWFLLNPTFALFSLFDIVDYPTAFALVSLLNLSLCGLTMYLFIASVRGARLSNLVFSTSYALMGFNVANVFQANFWIGPIMLPLVMMGLVRLVRGRGVLLYSVSLGATILMNFYFGFITAAASVLVFVALVWLGEGLGAGRKRTVITFGAATVAAGLLSAVVWLPALLSLRGGRLDQTTLTDFSFNENMPLLDIFSKLFTGANTTSELVDGLPNIYVGILPIALVVVFFVSEQVCARKKRAAAGLLIVYLLAFYIVAFDMCMHGGTVTNWFNFRYSYVFSFLLLVIASYQWEHIASVTKQEAKHAAVIMALVMLVVFSKQYAFIMGGEVLLDCVLLAAMLFMIRMHLANPQKNPKPVLEGVLLIIVSVNLLLNYVICTENILEWGIDQTEYMKTAMPVSAAVEAVQTSDADFYRMEVNRQRSGTLGNDPMLYGYAGVGHGGSDERDFVRSGLSQLGVHRFDMRNYYGEGIPGATDALLGIKYVIAEEDLAEEKGYERLVDVLGWGIYKNPNALPLAMISNAAIANASIDFEDVFANLNAAYSGITGEDVKVFTEETDISFTSHPYSDSQIITGEDARKQASESSSNDEPSSSEESKKETSEESVSESTEIMPGTYKEMPDDMSSIEYSFIAQYDGPVYTYNRAGLADGAGSQYPVLNYEGIYHKGDTVRGYLPVYSEYVSPEVLKDAAAKLKAGYADLGALEAACTSIRAKSCVVSRESETHLTGTFESTGEERLLFTIPYDEGWTCFVDGKEAQLDSVLGLFMAVQVEEGAHSFEMRYIPSGIALGAAASACGVGLMIAIEIIKRKKERTDLVPNQSVTG